jgi:uncharacterized membrane protein
MTKCPVCNQPSIRKGDKSKLIDLPITGKAWVSGRGYNYCKNCKVKFGDAIPNFPRIKRPPKYAALIAIIVRLVAAGFMLVMLDILVRAFIDPSYRVNVGEPNRWISGAEVLFGGLAVLGLTLEAMTITRKAAKNEL